MVTSGKEWRKAREEGIPFDFPSGNKANLRPIEADFFVRVGRIPDVLAPLVNEMISGQDYEIKMPPMEELEKKKEWVEFLNELCTYAFVSPKVVAAPQAEDEISVDDLSYVDKYFVFTKFSLPAHRLRGFRQAQAESVAVVEPSANNGRTGEPATAH